MPTVSAAETGSSGEPAAPLPVVERPPRWGPAEVLAILLLTVGAVFLPVVGPLIGLILVWMSGEWTTREKWVATLIVVVLLALPVLLLLGVSVGSGSNGSGA